jgi:hypothetical protein
MLYLFNTTICPNEGTFNCKKVSLEEAKSQVIDNWKFQRITSTGNFPTHEIEFTSAIGHQGSADAFNALFPGLGCEVNRIPATMVPGDVALCLKMRGRIQEGQILDLAAMEETGYDLFILSCLESGVYEVNGNDISKSNQPTFQAINSLANYLGSGYLNSDVV